MIANAQHSVRPARTTVVFWLLVAATFVLLGLAGFALAHAVQFDGEISRTVVRVNDVDPGEVRAERTGNVVATLLVCVPAMLLATWLAVTAVRVRRGSNPGRIPVFGAVGWPVLLCGLYFFCWLFFEALYILIADSSGVDTGVFGAVEYEMSRFRAVLNGTSEPFSDVFLASAFGNLVVVVLMTVVPALLATKRYRSPPPS